jgi:formimidoylglutamate deiminase
LNDSTQTTWLPDLIYADGRFQHDLALVCDDAGRIVRLAPAVEVKNPTRLANRALLPGLVNAHSHAFQRVLRGRTEHRTTNQQDSFWTWREMMYSAAARLTPDDIYDASCMAFLEMVLGGITAVGEFHYLHHSPEGAPYDDTKLLAKEVVRAARDVGLRIALLRVAYARAGFQTAPNPRQARFIEYDPETYLRNVEKLIGDLDVDSAWVGVAPHSVRAVSLDYLRRVVAYANERELPVHMHIAEQMAEVSACIKEYGRSPVALLETEGLLSGRFTAIHAIHVTPKAIVTLGRGGATVCACPTTERNLGDGVIPADAYFKEGVSIALGTDSHAQIDLLEDARELEYHLRLRRMERAVLVAGALAETEAGGGAAALAARLFDCATINGAKSIGASVGTLEAGRPADFFTVDLDDPSIAGASPDDLLASVVFSLSRAAVREVVVAGKQIVSEGQHQEQEKIVERFSNLQEKLWGAVALR